MTEDELLTAAEIAERVDVDRRTVSDWVRTDRDPPFPESYPTVRHGRIRDGYLWSEVMAWCEIHHLPNTSIRDGLREIHQRRQSLGSTD